MFGRERALALDALADALDDPTTDDGWLNSMQIAERSGVNWARVFAILMGPFHRGEVERDPRRDPDRPGILYYRLTAQGVRRRQREATRRASWWVRCWRSVVPSLR